MTVFLYKSIGSDGRTFEGRFEAPDRFAVYRKVKADGRTAIFVKEEMAAKTEFLGKMQALFGKVKAPEKINFARNLSAMIEAGLSITRALAVMEKQTHNKMLRAILMGLVDGVSKGRPLSENMKDYPEVFSALFVSMVKAGEESGNLTGSLKVVALQMEKAYLITKKVRGAMLYPTIIVSLMVVIGVLMMLYMVPTLTETFKGLGVDLPLSTRIVIAISEYLRSNFLLTISTFVAIIGGLIIFGRRPRGRRFFNRLVLDIPVIGTMVREVNAARTARTLSSLLSSGVDIVVAISVTEEVLQNVFFKEVIAKAQKEVERGEPMSGVFVANEKLFPIFMGEMISVGEETGRMSEMLLNVATFYEEEVDQKTKNISTVIEPLLMIIIGAAVGLFAISMLAPTYSLVEKI